MSKNIDIGAVSAFAMAVERGYTGTEAEFAQELANAGAYAQMAKDSEAAAAASATNAAGSESESASSAADADESEKAAALSAAAAAGSESESASSAADADESEKAAALSAAAAADSEASSVASAADADGSARDSADSATAAATSAAAAADSAAGAAAQAVEAAAQADRAQSIADNMDGVGVHRYGLLWDTVNAVGTRLYNAVGKVANAHNGTFNAALANDFNGIYPWNGMRLCNWAAGSATEKAKITAFEGEPLYSTDENMGAYRPEFWYKVEQQDDGKILFVVADGKLPDYTYNPPYMLTTFCSQDDGAGGLCCKKDGVQAHNVSLNSYNTKNAAQGMLTEDYWADGAEKLLMIVEFGTLNTQYATGDGFVSCPYTASHTAVAAGTGVNFIAISTANAAAYTALVGKATIGIGTSLGDHQIAVQRKLTAIEVDATDATISHLVFDGAAVNIAVGNIVYCVGAVYDNNPVGAQSGYVGTNGKSISYYRGAALQTGAYMWIANIMRSSSENLFVAPTDSPQTGTIGSNWVDTGVTLPTTEGYIKTLGVSKKCGLVVQPTGTGGDSAKPVGDYIYRPAVGASETALLSRGRFSVGGVAGGWCVSWWYSPATAGWYWAARALIRNPFGGAGVETPEKPN